MKALLIGGTGVISESISKLLIEQGHELYLLNRGKREIPAGANTLIADINDQVSVAALLADKSFDVVADFIAYTPDQVERDYKLFAGKTKQYIFISSASAYEKPPASPFINEKTPLVNPFWQYSRDKAACEDYLMDRYNNDGFPVTIIRPSHTYSHRSLPLALHGKNGSWQLIKRIQQGKPVLIHGDGTSLWTFTHSRDFAKAFVGIMNNPAALGEAVQIMSDESLTWNQAYKAMTDALGTELNALHVSSSLLVYAGKQHGYDDFEGTLIGDKSNSVVFDTTKLKTLVPGFKAEISYAQGVKESIEYHLEHPELQRDDPGFDAFCDDVVKVMQTAKDAL